jgi:hypothetical protein
MPSPLAQEKLAARARRIRTLRRRIVASVLATFVLAWGVVAFDGQMSAQTTAVASTTTTTSSTATSPTNTSTAASDPSATMTTSQS